LHADYPVSGCSGFQTAGAVSGRRRGGGLARQENRAGAGLVKRLGSVHENGRYVKLEEGRLDTAIVKP